MTPATIDAPELLKSLAADAGDGVDAAKRAIRSVQRRVENLGDLKDDAAHRVKRQPFTAVGIAIGVGFVLGMAVWWIGGRFGQTTSTCNE